MAKVRKVSYLNSNLKKHNVKLAKLLSLLGILISIYYGSRLSPMPPDNCIGIEENDRSRWGKVLERALTTTAVDSRAFRAGVILNPLRGLTAVENNAFHIERDVPSPVQPTDKIGYLLF